MKTHKKIIKQNKILILAVGGELGFSRKLTDKLASFYEKVYGETISKSGHYVPKEEPQDLRRCLLTFIDNINQKS
ncbi:hypothetical protein JCM15457_500 [Liquorilactobacillus sucicola DSM 21376 = JCM 15457]|uniref:Alpha/beta hydrolase n=1 Tax=Liquorilactobacillus sucicola DSM 21376 = JCM 15457 TaxID=1423806 RepID=A0A023CVR4_9LACO|nr:hypothetical protein [Liquorilactobacillus sucicola]KRN05544.1 hypothetical protein FD15_GL002106 [Liquorilactobacillus sucicola DSM 21376 = JCM 15457]GAJ25625.1 hypothetical protein JCM15457_500 [Liquorilactobacillus sucicola DSM 21376 = JCM 15457]